MLFEWDVRVSGRNPVLQSYNPFNYSSCYESSQILNKFIDLGNNFICVIDFKELNLTVTLMRAEKLILLSYLVNE